MTGQALEIAADLVQQVGGRQARQNEPGWVDGTQVAGAQQPFLADQNEDALSVGVGKDGESMFRLFVDGNILTKIRNTPVPSALTGTAADLSVRRRRQGRQRPCGWNESNPSRFARQPDRRQRRRLSLRGSAFFARDAAACRRG
jgi:hypothetical protein